MNKKLILLILVLPLCLMLSLFTTTSTVSLAFQVPVSGIEIAGSNVVYLDLDLNEKYKLEYTVYPTNAANQKVTFTTEQVGESRKAEFEYVDGSVGPKTVGMAKVSLTTVDGGFKDSFIVQVDSQSLQEISSVIGKEQIYVGEKTSIVTEFIPENAADRLVQYQSGNPSVAIVDNKGTVTGVGKGSATITVASVNKPEVLDTVEVTVVNSAVMDLAQSNIITSATAGTINISLETTETYTLSYKAYQSGTELTEDTFTATFDETNKETGNILLNYTFADTEFVGYVTLEITIETVGGSKLTKSCQIQKVDDVSASFDNENAESFTVGRTATIPFTVLPEDAEVQYSVAVSNENVVANMLAGQLVVTAKKPGVAKVTLSVTAPVSGEVIEIEKEIVVAPKVFAIDEIGKEYGIENVLTIGRTDVNGAPSAFALHLSYGGAELGENFTENVGWVTNTDKVTVDANGVVKILDETFVGLVEVKGVYSYGGVAVYTQPFTVRCVGNGVNVSSYLELLKATRESRVIVLQGSIKDDFGYENGAVVYEELNTTYDKTYYQNIDRLDLAKVKVLLQFKNDLYGNGYGINAHNVAYGLDEAGALKADALFRGPLNFAAASESGASVASVKSQDNICFAVYENVKINNVELRGCDLEADENGYDLTDLTYTGTTVEVLGDNVTIEYSRITNGRTTLRVFGDVADPTKVIRLNIRGSVLSGAREFILRMGSNCFVDGTKANPSPYLPEDTVGYTFPVQKTAYAAMTPVQKQAYDEKFIKTFVNVKNSIFKDAGIFAVGIDSHFSGTALADGTAISSVATLIGDWRDMAKTSYGAKLTLEEDVRMYCWKKLDDVDSSTLIEIAAGASQTIKNLEFNVKELLLDIYESNDNFKNIICDYKGTQYVHAGIAFFGGGKNYGVCEDGNTFSNLTGYTVTLSDVGRAELQWAAGNEPFYFLMHDASTLNFLPETQEEILNSDSAYDCIKPKA